MANGFKSGGKNFEIGVSGNPSGRPKESSLSKDIKHTSRAKFRELVSSFLFSDVNEIEKASKNKNSSYLEWAVANYLYSSVAKGDYRALEKIFERILGKVPTYENIKQLDLEYLKELKGKEKDDIQNLSPNQLERILEIMEEN